jgi:hypothetical protein
MNRDVSEIALLLADLRSKGPLETQQRHQQLSEENIDLLDKIPSSNELSYWSVADVWGNISMALLGNTSLICSNISQRGL